MPRLNTSSYTIGGASVSRGAKGGGGQHKFLGQPVKGGIKGSNALQKGLAKGIEFARTDLARKVDKSIKAVARGAMDSGLRTTSAPVGAGVNIKVINGVRRLGVIDIESLMYSSMLAAVPVATASAKAHMSRAFGHSKPLTTKGVRPSVRSMINFKALRKNGQIQLVLDPPNDSKHAGKLFGLNFGTGPFNSKTG